jgi:hypothetical protein
VEWIRPNAISEALEPVPAITGVAGAVVMFVQMLGGRPLVRSLSSQA